MSHRQKHDQGLEGQLGEEVPAAKEVSAAEESQDTSSSSASVQATAPSKASKVSGDQAAGGQSTSKAYLYSKFLLNSNLQKKVTDLVKFLSFKYITNEPVTEAEIQKHVVKEYKGYYALIFRHACECMEVVFGIEVKEVDSLNHTYKLLKILDLTYDGRISNEEGIPKTGLLVLILGVIFMEGNRASEKKIWDVLSVVGMYPDRHDFICGDPRKFITEDLVLENYLVYQPIPNSDPTSYEFLWGPRAQAETSKMKVLQFFSKVAGSSPTSFTALYKEALKDEEERARALLASTAISTAADNLGSGEKPSSVSHPE
ncbi:similar to mage-k1 [Rattus norvegicus]|uniref:MAGE family member A13 n=2 Tax=Rattus norvegicus TaxID=10116 RepID=Q5XIK4_RAT|nr:melanoma-associated antigen 11 [Rattus norvegicus]XP_038955607.1 melanoma-associated antigen 11 isoform X1 [Rattus norvegicus]AAH83676.1 Similar to mage-k1 [Rattus norvegicus]EDL86163.1 similar to mage-k1 [Rattus norvegicus]|eukprot:NP_001013984.1 melanoma-associated antigen 11 [Rattus norvegicus]